MLLSLMTALVSSVVDGNIHPIEPSQNAYAQTATCQKLPIVTVAASDNSASPGNVLDNNLNTYWYGTGNGVWIQADLGSKMNICDVNIAWYLGNLLSFNFVISVSSDGSTFTNVFTGKSSGTTPSFETYTLPPGTTGRYVRITVNGNNFNSAAAITELSVDGSSNVAQPPPQPTANNENIQTTCCAPVQITLTGTDPIPGDVLTFSVVTQPQHGTLTSGTVSSVVYYTPNTGFSGTDSFTYKATDGQGVSSSIATVTITVNAPPPVGQSTTGILLPLYMYPQVWISGNAYQQLANIAKAHPSVGITAIINPNSGPGTSQDSNFVQGISILKKAGIRVIGYTYTSYGSRPIADVEADIDRYISFYGSSISGVLFDEMSNTAGNENYYKTLSNYAKSKGLTFTVGNPGADTLPSYIGTVDTLAIYEGLGVPSLAYLSGGWHSNYGKQSFDFVAYGVQSLDQTYISNAAKYVGYMYITNDNLPNPWDTLPPYLEQLVTILEGTT